MRTSRRIPRRNVAPNHESRHRARLDESVARRNGEKRVRLSSTFNYSASIIGTADRSSVTIRLFDRPAKNKMTHHSEWLFNRRT